MILFETSTWRGFSMVINNTTLVSLLSLYTHSLVFYVESKKYESFYNQYFDAVTIRYQFQYVSNTINNTLNRNWSCLYEYLNVIKRVLYQSWINQITILHTILEALWTTSGKILEIKVRPRVTTVLIPEIQLHPDNTQSMVPTRVSMENQNVIKEILITMALRQTNEIQNITFINVSCSINGW